MLMERLEDPSWTYCTRCSDASYRRNSFTNWMLHIAAVVPVERAGPTRRRETAKSMSYADIRTCRIKGTDMQTCEERQLPSDFDLARLDQRGDGRSSMGYPHGVVRLPWNWRCWNVLETSSVWSLCGLGAGAHGRDDMFLARFFGPCLCL